MQSVRGNKWHSFLAYSILHHRLCALNDYLAVCMLGGAIYGD